MQSLWAFIKSAHSISDFSKMHSSRSFFVSGQAQQGFNFWSLFEVLELLELFEVLQVLDKWLDAVIPINYTISFVKMPEYSVLLPTYNERQNLPIIVYLLNKYFSKLYSNVAVDFHDLATLTMKLL